MPMIRKKFVEALQWDGTPQARRTVSIWSPLVTQTLHADGSLEIPTLEGRMRADVGDWIIRESFPTRGRRIYSCKPDIFAATYEPEGRDEVAEQVRA